MGQKHWEWGNMRNLKVLKRLVSFVLMLVLVVSFVPSITYANEPSIQVRVVVEGLEFDSVGSNPDWNAGRFMPNSFRAFTEGLLPVERNGRMGFVDRTGNIVIPLEYDAVYSFSEGLAVVENNNRYGFIDITGKVVVPLAYASAMAFSEGLAMVRAGGRTGSGRTGFIDTTGNVVIPLIYDFAYSFLDGRALVRNNTNYGFIDRAGQVIVPIDSLYMPQTGWDLHENARVDDFSEGLSRVVRNGREGFIDAANNTVIPFLYDPMDRLYMNAATWSEDGWILEPWNPSEYGTTLTTPALMRTLVRDRDSSLAGGGGHSVGDFFISMSGFNEGLAIVVRDGKWGAIDRTGREVVPLIYDFVFPFNEGLSVALRSDGTWAILEIYQPEALEQPSSWAIDQVSTAIAAGLVPQNLQSRYTQATTRAEFAALAVALYEIATGAEITGRMQFNDTNDINVQKMGYLGVVTGVGGGNFAPNSTLTREQAAVMLARLADIVGQPLTQQAATFADNAQISSWAVDSVGQIQAAGIMGGVGNNQFAPSGDYTREQSIVTILRLFELLR